MTKTTSDVVEIGSKTTSGTARIVSLCSELSDVNSRGSEPEGDTCDLSPPPNQILAPPVGGENGGEPLWDPKMCLVFELLMEDITSGPLNAAAKIPSRIDIRKPRMNTLWFWFGVPSLRSGWHSINPGCRVDKLPESRMMNATSLTYRGQYNRVHLFSVDTCYRLWFVCSDFWPRICIVMSGC